MSIKENLYTFIVKNGKVDSTRLVRWCRENGIGIVLLALALSELEKERKVRTGDKRAIGKISINGKEVTLELPTVVEAVQHHREHRQTSSTRRTSRRSTILDSILGVSSQRKRREDHQKVKEEKEEKREIKQIEKTHPRPHSVEETSRPTEPETQPPKASTKVEKVESKPEERTRKEKEKDIPIQRMEELENLMSEVRRTVSTEVESNPHNEDILNTVLAYLSKYWSVGELRLRIDISKMMSHKLNLKEEDIFDRVGKILKILRRFNIVEIVEPGVVNLLRKDIQVSMGRIRLLEVLGS